jgi:hypothetical protein
LISCRICARSARSAWHSLAALRGLLLGLLLGLFADATC